MTEERFGFVKGFMAAVSLYGENPFALGADIPPCAPVPEQNLFPPDQGPLLPYDKYLEIPTFIRQGKVLHV